MSRRYWFARRLASQKGNSIWFGKFSPISWEGWAMFGVFVGSMALGAGLWFESAGQGIERGWVGFVLLTFIGAGLLLASVGLTGDPDHTVEEYRSGRIKNGDGRGA